jgi:shikimate dehydrogenase
MPRLGVLGWPVSHSRSPAMHNAAFASLAMDDWRYQLLPVPPTHLRETVLALAASGFVGANVTIPHKVAALELAGEASDAARAIGAANTLTFDGELIVAENTDAPGLIAALPRPPSGMSAVVLGAGGSARAAAWALREAGASDIAVWNRTTERAEALARDLGLRAVSAPPPADLLVNCTSVGLLAPDPPPEAAETASLAEDATPPLEPSASDMAELNHLSLTFDLVGEYSYVVDLVYRSPPTALFSAALAHGAHALDGLEVLVAQGALSFERWTGRPAPIDVMRTAARGRS